MKPLVAIVSHTEPNRFGIPANGIAVTYAEAVIKGGGIPLILPFSEHSEIILQMVEPFDGFLFPGGIDVDPRFYAETKIDALGSADPELDRFQMTVFHAAVTRKKPVLGICRGIQLINVALGGSLYQDIPSQFSTATLKHMQDVLSFDVDHPVTIAPATRLHDIFGPEIRVNSRHHQSVKELGDGLIVTARAPDGVIEAAEHRELSIDLVQWHPELMLRKNDDMRCLFESFVRRCRDPK
ncbi:MAG: gamma-glutamyl-gamma-aminobutyrate hydrolase family protein [Desulfatirhabdiaceae bacterium]